jgi:hypothetical protein
MVWRSDSSTPIHETLECIGNDADAVSNYFSPHRWRMEKHCYESHTEGLVYTVRQIKSDTHIAWRCGVSSSS